MKKGQRKRKDAETWIAFLKLNDIAPAPLIGSDMQTM